MRREKGGAGGGGVSGCVLLARGASLSALPALAAPLLCQTADASADAYLIVCAAATDAIRTPLRKWSAISWNAERSPRQTR